MYRKPKLKCYVTVFPIGGGAWGLRGAEDELWRIKLRGAATVRAFTRLLPRLDGEHELERILGEVEAEGSPAKVCAALLERLAAFGLLEEGDLPELPPERQQQFQRQIAFFSRFSAQGGEERQMALGRRRVAVLGEGYLGRCLGRQLWASGIGVDLEGQGSGDEASPPVLSNLAELQRIAEPELLILAQERLQPELPRQVDRWAKEHGRPWLLVRALEHRAGWVGPLFVPGETACYLSLEARLSGNLPFYEERRAFASHLGDRRPGVLLGGLHSCYELLAAIATVETVKTLEPVRSPYLAARFLTVDYFTWEVESHDVLRVPGLDQGWRPRPSAFAWKEAVS